MQYILILTWELGTPEIEGFSDGWLLGTALILGFSDGREDGWPDILGFSDGWDVGQCDIEGFSDGLDCWMVTRSCVCHHSEMCEMYMTTLVFNDNVWIQKHYVFDITNLRAWFTRDTRVHAWLRCWPIWLWRILRRLTTGLCTYRWRLRRVGRWLTR